MKGFPNQIAELDKIERAIRTVVDLVDQKLDARDDGVFGEALVRAGVAGTGHTPRPIEAYLREQRTKEPSNQSFRTTARGLRELFRLMSLIVDSGSRVQITDLGRQAAGLGADERIEFWRRVVNNIVHTGPDGATSHPYQMLLRLVGRKPGITRAKCALALEARNDSPEELDRIVALADLDEDDIRVKIGVSKSNWDNAKKVLPKFAEQLGDVVRSGQSFTLARSPGSGVANGAAEARERPVRVSAPRRPIRAPRGSREVTPATIATVHTAEEFDEITVPRDIDPAAALAAVRQRRDRWRRHQALVTALANRLSDAGATLHADPFDILADFEHAGILVEVKTLDGTAPDERSRVMEALAQLLYYEAFVTTAAVGEIEIHKVACFEAPITEAHQAWLNKAAIGALWKLADGRFAGDALAARMLSSYIDELR